jgi:hypothetical protein
MYFIKGYIISVNEIELKMYINDQLSLKKWVQNCKLSIIMIRILDGHMSLKK